jgi:hypothetical protein
MIKNRVENRFFIKYFLLRPQTKGTVAVKGVN